MFSAMNGQRNGFMSCTIIACSLLALKTEQAIRFPFRVREETRGQGHNHFALDIHGNRHGRTSLESMFSVFDLILPLHIPRVRGKGPAL